jgi:hypothetical protein
MSARLSRRRFLFLFLSGLVVAGSAMSARLAAADEDAWLQNVRQTELWSKSRGGKVRDLAPAWSYFKVIGPQDGARIPVEHPLTGERVYIDAEAVGPSGPPPAGWAFTPAPPPATLPFLIPVLGATESPWVSNFVPARLWTTAGMSGVLLGEVDPGNYFRLLEPQRGSRLRVEDRITSGEVYVDAETVGPVVGPPATSRVPSRWWGYVGVDDSNVRADPTDDSTILGTLARGRPVVVEAWIEGQEVLNDQPGWARLSEGIYVYGPLLRKARIETPPPMPSHGALADRWIDVNRTQQTVTAYQDNRPVYMALTSSGRPGWETHEGIHEILWRKERETMDSSTLLGQDAARASYRIENIRWTQYFTRDGQAIHENFWRDPALIGIPSSHGCLGMSADDAFWFWQWASQGTPVSVHD